MLALSCALLACAPRPGPELLTPAVAPPDAKIVRILVATNRQRATPAVNLFTNNRSRELNFAEFEIAAPANSSADPTHASTEGFVVVDQKPLSAADFKQRLSVLRNGKRTQQVTVFVHGYNNNFQESLLRHAQLSLDAGFDHPQVLFAWPSQATVRGYLADRDSVIYSRDYLAELLISLAENPGVGRIRLVAHSMGGSLAMETLRQLRIARKNKVINRIDVVLAAPDIDADVFRQQIEVIGPLTPPLKLLVSKDDRALSLSGRLAASHVRAGALDVSDPRVQEAAMRYRVEVIDISQLKTSDRNLHDRFAYLAALYPRIAASHANAGQSGVFIFDSVNATLTGPFDQ